MRRRFVAQLLSMPSTVSFQGEFPLEFNIVAKCSTTKARTAVMRLPHSVVETPVFMPVGTQGTLKGILPEQLIDMDCRIMLANTYHLGHRPGDEIVKDAGGLHSFMNWPRSLLTDSGGFQMVSLVKLSQMTEEGVKFQSPHDATEKLLTPEESIRIQNALGADIIMQLDDVVHSLTTGERVEEAMHRSIRWLDRCIAAHKRPKEQNLFPIIQGGLDLHLRTKCVEEMTKRSVAGFAIGGLSGGEEKDKFCQVVSLCTDLLPENKPRYVMGVGWAVDLVVSCALGADMFDCVYPTRTARFGCALVAGGQLNLKLSCYSEDFAPIDANCLCTTCAKYTRAYLNSVVTHETVACHLVTIHNIYYQLDLMKRIRESIKADRFVEFVQKFMVDFYPNRKYPEWIVNSLLSVGITLL